ncbi:CREB-regulated transcription coactivator 1-like isoform X1 [Varroa jacobsoni]|uniref:CREB-regulated transcription coactivator 1-like isoform X1 n=1 Tax=Varroa jacobsoni TaxID=62625 RepID=UPI000BF29BD8|nr:CREB-regulated transcription coactivator 1-like isoform X1 [Varroa jacobsoni]XP_022705677.1 CREB-regulated transcription coactivator 1-like isoform X1 [Varroa jacobsoni]
MAAAPRKFIEKIALHTQKQAEETAAFEQILRETKAAVSAGVSAKTGVADSGGGSSGSGGSGGPLLNIPEPRGLGAFRGGSLPNVAQGTTGQGGLQGARRNGPVGEDSQIDLADALNSLESMKRGDVSPGRGRAHHRQRAATASSHQRYDVSPYSSSNYLPLPHDSNWRRTNSDSAINQSPLRDANFHQTTTSPSHRRSTVNSCSQSEVMQQLGLYPDDQTPCRPRSAEADTRGPMGHVQIPSLAHLSPPPTSAAPGGMALGHSGSLPDLTNLHFATHGPLSTVVDGVHPVSSHVSGVTSLDGSPESVYSDYHDFHDCQGSPVHQPMIALIGPTAGGPSVSTSVVGSCSAVPDAASQQQQQQQQKQQQQQPLHNGNKSNCTAAGQLANPQVSPPRITVEGLTLDTIALSLNGVAGGSNAPGYGTTPYSPEGSPCSPLASSPPSPLGGQSPSQGIGVVSNTSHTQMNHTSHDPSNPARQGSGSPQPPPTGANGPHSQHHNAQSLNNHVSQIFPLLRHRRQAQYHQAQSLRRQWLLQSTQAPSSSKRHYYMSPMSNNASAMAAGTGNGNFRIVQQQPHSLPTRVLHQVALNGGSNSIYDAYYNLVELNKLSQADQTMTQTTDGLQGYYNGLASGLQSPGSAGIPEIILTEPGALLDECSNNSLKVLSSSVGSGGQYFTPSPSPTGSPLPLSPHHEMHSSLSSGQGGGVPPGGGILQPVDVPMPNSNINDTMLGFDDLFPGDQYDLENLQLLPEQEAAIMAAVGGAHGFTAS